MLRENKRFCQKFRWRLVQGKHNPWSAGTMTLRQPKGSHHAPIEKI